MSTITDFSDLTTIQMFQDNTLPPRTGLQYITNVFNNEGFAYYLETVQPPVYQVPSTLHEFYFQISEVPDFDGERIIFGVLSTVNEVPGGIDAYVVGVDLYFSVPLIGLTIVLFSQALNPGPTLFPLGPGTDITLLIPDPSVIVGDWCKCIISIEANVKTNIKIYDKVGNLIINQDLGSTVPFDNGRIGTYMYSNIFGAKTGIDDWSAWEI